MKRYLFRDKNYSFAVKATSGHRNLLNTKEFVLSKQMLRAMARSKADGVLPWNRAAKRNQI